MFTDNNYYLCTDIDNKGNFKVIATLPIDGNEDLINEIRREGRGKDFIAIPVTESTDRIISEVRSRGGRNSWDDIGDEGFNPRAGRDAALSLGQQAGPNTDIQQTGVNGQGKKPNFSLSPKITKAYDEAVEKGDEDTAARMVKEAAKEAMPDTKVVDKDGYPLVVYHGSDHPVFHIFDLNRSEANSVFLSTNKIVGGTYTPLTGVREVGHLFSEDEWYKYLNEEAEKCSRIVRAVNGTDSEAFKTLRGAYKCILKLFLTVFHTRIGHLLHYNNRSQ